MLSSIEIRNFKSIQEIDLSLGRINVLIGENGAGKSNILEAIALAGASDANRLDNEFLVSRGIRVTSASLMKSAFTKRNSKPIAVTIKAQDGFKAHYEMNNDNRPYSKWKADTHVTLGGSELALHEFTEHFKSIIVKMSGEDRTEFLRSFSQVIEVANSREASPTGNENNGSQAIKGERKLAEVVIPKLTTPLPVFSSNPLSQFVVYSPENSALRNFAREGQIQPLGVNGEGLLKLLSVMSKDKDTSSMRKVKTSLRRLSWFDDFSIVDQDKNPVIEIKDIFLKYLPKGFDQNSANEGFFFLLFYLVLFNSKFTPSFFGIDNVNLALNPKLCEALISELTQSAKLNDRQAIITTHNPAVLDGLNLHDDDQRLFIVSRDRQGRTQARRLDKKPPQNFPTRLSELFLRGALGGLPKNF